MPEWMTWVVLMLGGIGGLSGIGAYVRAHGQNRVDDRRALTEEQQQFRQAMAAELGSLRQLARDLETDKDKLESRLNDTVKLSERLLERSESQERRIKDQDDQIIVLRTQNAEQAHQIAALTEERAAYIERLKIAEAKNDFMERENGELRREVQRLREKLPARVDVTEDI